MKTMSPLIPDVSKIPKALQDLKRWIPWKAVAKNDGKVDKVPYDYRTGRRCDAHDPRVWSSFEEICTAYASGGWDGIGIMPGDGVLGVDLDKCRDHETGAIEVWAQEVIEQIASYTEVSPSGTGIRAFVRGVAPGLRKKGDKVEMYNGTGGNFLTVTGHLLPGLPPEVVENQAGVDWLYSTHLAGDAKSVAATYMIAGESRLTDKEVLDAIRASAQGEKFAALYDDGDWEGYYPSQSEADMALMTMLAWWTGSDPEQMERIFSGSQLAQRDKWQDREDYRKSTLAEAIKANGGKHFHARTRP
jgi:primase-polymerase (primpol)-like protein